MHEEKCIHLRAVLWCEEHTFGHTMVHSTLCYLKLIFQNSFWCLHAIHRHYDTHALCQRTYLLSLWSCSSSESQVCACPRRQSRFSFAQLFPSSPPVKPQLYFLRHAVSHKQGRQVSHALVRLIRFPATKQAKSLATGASKR